ncbi:diguanylate cyclase [Vibrio variabilis]|uniref:diguanylate cyclase n=1 Tax=Vibrio variabilis TaxID=990271 RepID=A0ABR4Y7S4_9VIBR|nr:ligand-binding sensor domain-containing diguanylate cyclase [Vibrio variabilis]KHA59047.1 diguanylate cyclase [Vibrio variabilis]
MNERNWSPQLVAGLIYFVLFFVSPLSARASELSEYLFETWTSRDGLPHNSINAITQTDDGYLWFATWEGLARFNGHRFEHFTRGVESGLIDSGVRALYADANGGLLAGGVRGGLTYRHQRGWQPVEPAGKLINTVLRDPNGGIWIGTQSLGLVYRASLEAKNEIKISSVGVYKLTLALDGDVLVSTNKGLFKVGQEGVVNISAQAGLDPNPIYDAIQLSNGEFLFGGKHGAWRFDANNKLHSVHPALDSAFITRILADDSGDYWFGTINNGVYRLSNNTLTHFNERSGLLNNRVLSLFQDRERSIWIGTNGGLTRLHKAPFTVWDQHRGLAGDYVRTVLALDSGDIIAGTSRGLSVIRNREIRNVQTDSNNNELLSILSLAPRAEGGAWVGTYNRGVYLFDGQTLAPYPLDELPTHEVRAILQDKQNQHWFGTTAGLLRRSPDGTTRLFTVDDGLVDNYVMALAQDKHGHIWVGSAVGVAVIRGDKVEQIDLTSMEDAQYVFGFYSQGSSMWLATDRGLVRYRFSDKKLSLIGRPQGLPIDKFFQVIPDHMGYFWLTSNRGLWRISLDQANAIADGRATGPIRFELYNERDGMRTAQVNGGSNPAATIDNEGTLWFPTAQGVASTNPRNTEGLVVPHFPTVIERLTVDKTQYDLAQPHVFSFPAGSQRVSFDYVGLGFLSAQHIRYRTKLEGLDNSWVSRGSQTSADYTNLAPGHYRFVVKAYYEHHESDVNLASVEFVVLPYWWQRASVQIGLFLLLAASIALLFWWRLRLLKRSELRLKNEVIQKTLALRKQAAAFEVQAREDQLTRLNNRRAFDEWIEKVVYAPGQSTSFSLALIDIDHFKQINDTYTHLAGDQVLKIVAQEIKNATPQNGFVARWGGEEFVIGFRDWEPNKVFSVCESLRNAIKQRDFGSVAEHLTVTISTGIVNSDNSHDFDLLLRRADRALLHVKANGRDNIYVHSE